MDTSDVMEDLEMMVEPLLKWFQKNKRILPWRDDPTPYHVWISEIMLQQTRVEAVKDYYAHFMKALPDIRDLAQVSDDDLMKLWQGLGYYNRARNLKKAAQRIVEEYDGKLPNRYEALLTLPGIGSYTAGAIASIAYQIKVPAVDGNVLRVMMRVLGSEKNISRPSTKVWLEERLSAILPDRVGDFNQALMELGALVCVPNGEPKCQECPLRFTCQAYQTGMTTVLPIKDEKKTRKIEDKTVLLFYFNHNIALWRRKNSGLLAGLFEFPNVSGHLTTKEVIQYLKQEGIEAIRIEPLPSAKHIFSHVEWNMIGYKIVLDDFVKERPYIWSSLEELHQKYAIPTAFGTYLELVIEELSHRTM